MDLADFNFEVWVEVGVVTLHPRQSKPASLFSPFSFPCIPFRTINRVPPTTLAAYCCLGTISLQIPITMLLRPSVQRGSAHLHFPPESTLAVSLPFAHHTRTARPFTVQVGDRFSDLLAAKRTCRVVQLRDSNLVGKRRMNEGAYELCKSSRGACGKVNDETPLAPDCDLAEFGL